MTFEIDNEKIGGYIANLIKQYYSSDRDFCRQYLKRRNIESNNDEVSKMANRLSQIKRGKNQSKLLICWFLRSCCMFRVKKFWRAAVS